jgi:hypothetical protein
MTWRHIDITALDEVQRRRGSVVRDVGEDTKNFIWYKVRHLILVWPIAALRNELSANQKGVFMGVGSVESYL